MNLLTAWQAIRELGPAVVAWNALYRLGLRIGYFQRWEPQATRDLPPDSFRFLFDLPDPSLIRTLLGASGLEQLLAEADQVAAGQYRLFGGEPRPLRLSPPSLRHWTQCKTAAASPDADIKFVWEPARFGWAFTLGRAYHVSGEERYAEAFWQGFAQFQTANPPYRGENWLSGQEAALRLMAFVWAGQVFAPALASTPLRMRALTEAITRHAWRIPPTLLYARSQNNNHLLTEAAALYTAALALPAHPHAPRWRQTGLRWLNWCFENQIEADGEYVQHSTNYHRLMLQTALWVFACQRRAGERVFSSRSLQALARAARWLLALLDPASGRVPNLGPNDGAYIFPLSLLPFADFRPVAYAAARAFTGAAFPAGLWDEMAWWFGVVQTPEETAYPHPEPLPSPDGGRPGGEKDAGMTGDVRLPKLLSPRGDSWAYLRAVEFRSRPGHADLLHLDLWRQGHNLTLDPGTYLYNAPPPWDNPLTAAWFHNTVTLAHADQFTRAGRFLYLNWRQVRCGWRFEGERALVAWHTAYRHRFGVTHERRLEAAPDDAWHVTDTLRFDSRRRLPALLHWLLPDAEIIGCRLEPGESRFALHLRFSWGTMQVEIRFPAGHRAAVTLVRAGELLWSGEDRPADHPLRLPSPLTPLPKGEGDMDASPLSPPLLLRGWVSPTYGVKLPALSLAVAVESDHTFDFETKFFFKSSPAPLF